MSYILIVDAFSGRDVIEDILRLRGYEVFTSASVSSAKKIITEQGIPAVVLIDIYVPGQNAESFMQEMSEEGSLVIAMSELDIHKELPADAFLRKPFYLEDFEAVLRQYG